MRYKTNSLKQRLEWEFSGAEEGKTGSFQGVLSFGYTRLVSPGDLLYSIAPISNNTIVYI